LSSTGGGLCDCGRCELRQPAFKGVLHKLGVAARRFLGASASRAQMAALSADVMLPTAVNSFSRNPADCSGPRVLGRSPCMP
jgi:hypothetical protein